MSIAPTPGNRPAWWSPTAGTFLLRPGLSQVERRCALSHELAHRALEHSGTCTYPDARRQAARREAEADEWAARQLIPLKALIDTLAWTDDRDEAADDLWVTPRLLQVRLDTLYGGERMQVRVELRARGVQ